MLVENLIERYPTIYHMAEAGTWESIRNNGLMSTSAVLDHFGYQGKARDAVEAQHRPNMVKVGQTSSIILRDQKPMPPDRLGKALIDGTTTGEWYRLINRKVFFWAQKHRLANLLKSYGSAAHDVLHIDTQCLIARHEQDVWLSHMNSGNTLPIPHHRGKDLFKRIEDYRAKPSGKPEKEVVEIVVDYAVPRIEECVLRVERMQGAENIGTIWQP